MMILEAVQLIQLGFFVGRVAIIKTEGSQAESFVKVFPVFLFALL
jgi:hypothetical protein